MANEFKHKDPGTALTQAEFIASDGTGHIFDSQAAGEILYASSTTVLARLAKATDGNVLELASGLPAWTASPTIGSTSWANANHAHAASNSGGTLTTLGTVGTGVWQGTAIASAYIAADAITGAKIADDAIDSEHYTDGSIDNAHLADDAVDSDEIAAGAIDTAHIADNQVTLAKMAGITRGSIIYGDASGDHAALEKGTETSVLTAGADDIAWAAAAAGGNLKQFVQVTSVAYTTGTTTVPDDDTKPQNDEGVEMFTLAITPNASDNDLIIMVHATWAHSATGIMAMSLFQDSTASALATSAMRIGSADTLYNSTLIHRMAAGTTSSTTFKVRMGNNAAGTMRLNGVSARLYGGALESGIKIFEVDV